MNVFQLTQPGRPLAVILASAVLFVALLFASYHDASAQQSRAISIIRDSEIETYIREKSDPIFRAAGLQPSSVQIYIVNDRTVNAFVTGGQNVFIHIGLMLEAETPNELIGVIAHETAHIAGGHIARTHDAIDNIMLPAIITMGLGILAIAAGAPDAGAAIFMGSQHIAERAFLAYSRNQEASADQAAVGYLDATGQSSVGLMKFFARFRDQEVLTERQQDPYVRSHPLSRDRMAALENRVNNSPYRDVRDSPESLARYEMIKAKLRGFVDPPARTLRRYADDDSMPGLYARAIAHHRQPNIDEAHRLIDRLIAMEPDNPYFHELKGQVLFEHGRAREAVSHYRRAVELSPNEVLIRINLAKSLLAIDESAGANLDDAKKHLETALRMDPRNPFGWHQMAIIHARQDNQALAALATAERYFILGDMEQARSFAARARARLPNDTPEWRRANDIFEVGRSPEEMERERQREQDHRDRVDRRNRLTEPAGPFR